MSSGPGERPNAVISVLLAPDQAVVSRRPNEATATAEPEKRRPCDFSTAASSWRCGSHCPGRADHAISREGTGGLLLTSDGQQRAAVDAELPWLVGLRPPCGPQSAPSCLGKRKLRRSR